MNNGVKYEGVKLLNELKPGMLMTVPRSVHWHSGYYLNEDNSLGDDMRLVSGDVVMYMETQINKFQPDYKRYKCLYGDRYILISERALVPVKY